jgi:cellulose synthase/poly-beta-1,6-N-acetylglucosamine synthase-like glycosyltransferase
MEIAFWVLFSIVWYVHCGYPFLLFILPKRPKKRQKQTDNIPAVTLIIAAHNEEEVIAEKIENVLSLDYPKDKLQIVVASDASTDKTNEIVRNYSVKGIELYEQKEHKGKSPALNHIIEKMAKGDIIVFNDATTLLEKDSIQKIVSYFSDDKAGAVTGKLIFKGSSDFTITENHGLYWRYEEFLKETESKVGYLPFVSGPFYAIRRNLYTPVLPHLPDDSVSPLGVYKKGFRVLYAKDAIAYETGAVDAIGEFKIKARGVVRELGSILHFKSLLNPFKYPMLFLVLISHRLLRWSIAFLLIAMFFVNLNLFGNLFFRVLFWIQVTFYFFAVCRLLIKGSNRVMTLPFYYCLVNAAALWGIIQFLLGKKQAVWEPVRT